MNVAIIQARMASKRMPGKAMLPIGDKPLIDYVIRRAMKIKGIDAVVLATSVDPTNDPLEEYARTLGIEVFRGDEDDVVSRFHSVASKHQADTIVRVTGDNPLYDFSAMSLLLERHNATGSDYSCMSDFPVGAVGDIFSQRGLFDTYANADGKKLADHVDLYILENVRKFKTLCLVLDRYMGHFRLTVDDADDLDRIRRLQPLLLKHALSLGSATVKQVLRCVGKEIWEANIQPTQASVSPENKYTAELVKAIPNREMVWYNDLA